LKFLFIYLFHFNSYKKDVVSGSLTMSSQETKQQYIQLSKHFIVTREEFLLLCDELIKAHKHAVTIDDSHQREVLTFAIEYASTCFGAEHDVATDIEFMAGEHGGLNETCVVGRDLSLKDYVFIVFGSRSVYIGLNPHHARPV